MEGVNRVEQIVVRGGRKLNGTVAISGAKNSTLPILVAAALGKGPSVIEGVPRYTDVTNLIEILRALGVTVNVPGDGSVQVDGSTLTSYVAPYEHVRKLRASFYVAGLLLARLGRAEVPFPGGDAIGVRGIDFHLDGFKALGAECSVEHGFVRLKANRLKGTTVFIGRSSVGATVNLMLAATMAEGTTVLEGAAREPEIVDLAVMLNKMGAKIRGAGTPTITIDGVSDLGTAVHEVIPDRIEAGTYMIAAAMTGGEVTLENAISEHMHAVITKMREIGAEVECGPSGVTVRGPERPKAADVSTNIYPGFPTDLQPQYVAMMCVADGISTIRETIWENRFAYADELRRMGAQIHADYESVTVRGTDRLTGAYVESPRDIRGGAALILAGLVADGETVVSGVHNIDRGYEAIERKLAVLGADIQRIEAEVD